jgi:predicted kinase
MAHPPELQYRPQLLVISGHSGSGKTTLAKGLVNVLGLPLVSKDVIKEALFDSLGWSDRAWSRRLGAAAIAVLYRQLAQLLAARHSCIVESSFRADLDGPRLRELCAQHSAQPLELQCTAPGELLVARVRERIASGQRHPGHGDERWIEDHAAQLRAGPPSPLNLGGPLQVVDTSGAQAPDLDALSAWAVAQRLPLLRAGERSG